MEVNKNNMEKKTKKRVPERYEFVGTGRSLKLKLLTNSLCKKGETFTTIDNGNGYKVIYEDGVVFKDQGRMIKSSFGWLNKSVVKEAEQRVADGIYVPKNKKNEKEEALKTVLFNPEVIKESCHGVECIAIDMTMCYFRTAKLIGVISDELYEKALARGKKDRFSKDFKVALSSSIGSLGSIEIVREYVKGKQKPAKFERKETNVCRLDIIDRVWEVGMSIIDQIPEGFLMFLTDCFYVLPEYAELVCSSLTELGYEYKTEKVWFDKLEARYYGGVPTYSVTFIKESNMEKFRKGERTNDISVMGFGVKNVYGYVEKKEES